MNPGQSGVVDLNKEVAFVIVRGKNDIPFNFRSYICVFQNPLFFDRDWKRDFEREFVTKND